MDKLKVKIVNKSSHALPAYSTSCSAGMDIRANLESPVLLKPFQRAMVPTGLFIELPRGYEAQIRPRSGLALKYGVSSINDPGTIDADYRGEISILLINLSDTDFIIKDGERVCQMIISKHDKVEWDEVDVLDDSERGDGGFGHTGNE